MKILCWNVNGVRAIMDKGFLDFLEKESPDALCIQESKIQEKQLTQELRNPLGYFSEWSFAQRPGYSGTATFSKVKANYVAHGLGRDGFDHEGRMVVTEFDEFVLVNVYIPNGGRGPDLVKFKLDFYDEMLGMLEKLRAEGKNLVICGDFNTAHKEVDIARPSENENVSGFLPVERAWLDKFVAAGYVDVFRELNPDAIDAYTWWSYRSGARERNVGWRIDYFFVNREFLPHVKKAWILADVNGSDHCPIGLEVS